MSDERKVTWAELGSGLTLAAGKEVVLLVGPAEVSTTTGPPTTSTTGAPVSTTSAPPGTTTTEAPGTTTTEAPGASTTQLPSTTTTQAPASTSTLAPGATTTRTVASAKLEILAADGTAGHADDKVRLGPGDGLQLRWSAAGAARVALEVRQLLAAAGDAPAPESQASEKGQEVGGAGPISSAQLAAAAIDLPVDGAGAGSGVVRVDPGPGASTEYTITVEPLGGGDPVVAKVTAFVANFCVQLELPDGSDYARNMSCVLEIEGQPPVEGETNGSGVLWLWVPNTAAERATLRLRDGGAELCHWAVEIRADESVASGALALNDTSAAGDDGERVA